MTTTPSALLSADELAEMKERDARVVEPLNAAGDRRRLLAAYEALRMDAAYLRGLINAHNDGCQSICGYGELEGVACKYRPYFPRRCPDCPTYNIIDIDESQLSPSTAREEK